MSILDFHDNVTKGGGNQMVEMRISLYDISGSDTQVANEAANAIFLAVGV